MRRPAATSLLVVAHVVVLFLGLAGAARQLPIISSTTSDTATSSSSSSNVSPTTSNHHLLPAAHDSTRSAESAAAPATVSASIPDGSNDPDFQATKAAFLQQYGQDYGYSGWLDANYHHEVQSRFGPHMQHYLDFTGSALFTRSHIRAASALLEEHTFSNPHSRNPSSLAAEQQVQEARQRVLQFFNADEAEYTVIWTSGATAALKLVGEAFPWTSPQGWQPSRHRTPGGYSDTDVGAVAECGAVRPGALSDSPETSQYVYLRSNHKSVLGIGAYAKARGCQLSCVTEADMEEWLNTAVPSTGSAQAHVAHAQAAGANAAPVGQQQHQQQRGDDAAAAAAGTTFSLVAYPSKDNYEGRLHSLEWIDKVHAKSTDSHKWLVVLDAAAHVPTHMLDLSHYKPDFVPVSFYKLFGFPSGLGALIARKESVELLHKIYFGGGSVVDSTAEDVWRVLMPPPDGYEDGTQNFLSIAQLHSGFKQLEQLGGIQAVEKHVRTLQAWMYEALSTLTHSNGAPLIKLFGHHHLRDPTTQSCIFQLLVLKPDGSVVSSASVEKLAAAQGIGIREGCMCNPSACLVDLGITPQEQQARILNNTDVSSGFLTVWRPAPDGSGKLVPVQLPTGSVRASLGYLSTFEDVWAYVQFLRRNYKDGGQSNVEAASAAAAKGARAATGRVYGAGARAASSQHVMVE